MNFKILLFVLSAAAISSCSTAYRSGQTPDDVYYSPTRVVEEDQQQDREETKNTDFEEREIRMAVHDRRWRDFDDDFDHRYDPYKYGYSYGYYYNPYYCHYPVYITNVTISNPKNSTPRMANLGSYNNTTYGISNTKYGNNNWKSPVRSYNNSNNNSSLIRRILTPPANNNSSTNSTRSYSPSSGSSSGSSSSGSSSGSVSRPKRGG
ncbi:MAG: hypothetical protein ABI741_16705 [Ferruginibacter sp.]